MNAVRVILTMDGGTTGGDGDFVKDEQVQRRLAVIIHDGMNYKRAMALLKRLGQVASLATVFQYKLYDADALKWVDSDGIPITQADLDKMCEDAEKGAT